MAFLASETAGLDSLNLIDDELTCRAHVPMMVQAFTHPATDDQRARLLDVLYHVDDPLVASTLRNCMTDEISEEAYYCTMYIAKKGDTTALAILNRHYGEYPVSSLQWSFSVALFGKFRYSAATEHLLESLDLGSLNVDDAAQQALKQLYPQGPEPIWPPDTLRVRWTHYLKQVRAIPSPPPS